MIKFRIENIFFAVFLLAISQPSLSLEDNFIKIGIVHSEKTKQLLHKNDNGFYPILDWELLLMNNKWLYSVLEDNDLNELDPNEYDVLILPSVEILSDQALENIREFLGRGGNLFVLGKLGSYNPQLAIRKPDALEILTGLYTAELSSENKISETVSFYKSNFLTQELDRKLEFLTLKNLNLFHSEQSNLNTTILAAYLPNEENKANANSFAGAVAIQSEKGSGQILWFGFQLSQISLTKENESIFTRIIFNGISWLAGSPQVWVNSYPEFYRSATLFSVWIDDMNSNLNKSLQFFKEKKIPLNFFISPSAVKETNEEIYKLSSMGKLNVLFNYFSYLNSDSAQIKMIVEETLQIMKAGSRQKYFGVQFLNMNEHDIYEVKLKKYFDFILNSRLQLLNPKIEKFDQSNINVECYYLNSNKGINDDIQESLYKKPSEGRGVVSFILRDNALFNLNSQLREKLNLIHLDSQLNYSYFTTYPALINWYKTKNNLELNISEIKDQPIFKVMIKNIGDSIAEQIGLIICIPLKYRTIRSSDYNYRLYFNNETGYYNLLIPFLHAGHTITLDIEYEK